MYIRAYFYVTQQPSFKLDIYYSIVLFRNILEITNFNNEAPHCATFISKNKPVLNA